MAKKRTYEAEIKVTDSFSKLLDKFTKQLDSVDKKIDKVNKNKIKVQAELDSSFKNAAKQIEKQIPNNKKIKVSASQDISRELDKANRDIFEMNRKLNANLDSSFKKMASNANKSVQSINSAVSKLNTSSLKMPTGNINSKLSNTLKSTGTMGKGSGLSNLLLGGNLATNLLGNKSQSQTGKALAKAQKDTEKSASKMSQTISKMFDKIKSIASKFKMPSIKMPKISMPKLPSLPKMSNPLSSFNDSVNSHKVTQTLMGDNYTPKGLPKLYKGDNKIVLSVQDNASKAVAFLQQKLHNLNKSAKPILLAVKDMATNIIGRISNKLHILRGKAYYATVAAKDKATSIITGIINKLHVIRGKAYYAIVAAKDKASNVINKVTNGLKYVIRHPFKATLAAVDKASQIIKKVLSSIKSITSKVAKVVVTAVDKASGIIKSIGGKIAGLAKAAGAIVIGGGALAISEGMNLEKQMVSMQHFMDKLNPGGDTDGYIKQLRDQANNTPFETGEIMGVGARALQVSNGDLDKSMKLVKMASDMAAANPGKSVEQAMEALADANLGESARLTEFGIKMSSDELQESGGLDGLINEGGALDKLYTGASESLSKTASGKWSTITGKMKSGMADMGKSILDAVNNAGLLDGVIGKIDAMFAGNNAQTFAQNIIDTFVRLKDALAPAIEPIKNMFSNMFGNVDVGSFVDGIINGISRLSQAAAPIIEAFCGIIQNLVPRIQPIVDNVITIFEKLSPAFTTVVEMITPVLDFFMSVFEKVSQFIIDNSETINSIIEKVGEIWDKVWGALSVVLDAAWKLIEPILSALLGLLDGALGLINGFLDGIGKVGNWIGDKWNSFTSWLGGDGGSTKSNAAGLERVPYDGYQTVLHQGEMVLTRNMADQYRQGGNTPNVTFGNITINSGGNPKYDAKEFIKEVVNELSGAMINTNPVY